MEIVKYLEIITNYQISLIAFSLILIAIIIGGVFYYYTNDIKPAILTFLSVLAIPILTSSILIILYEYFEIIPSEKHTLIMWSALFINVINLSILVSKYAQEVTKKDFDIDHVTRYHFDSTLNLFILILLIIGAVVIFMQTEMIIILVSILAISSCIIWLNHLIARLLLKDK